jgi:DNA-binding LacI/PurR family transcriptional regulator
MRHDFEYARSFDVPADLLAMNRVVLRCFGLDTLCRVFLNGRKVADTDNMHVTWGFEVKDLLKPGENTITIAFASPSIRAGGVVDKRLQGYRRALAEFGVAFDPALIFTQEISVEEGKRLGHILGERKEITGIFASADILAAGIMAGLQEMGLVIPRDKSIVGFDDNYLCRLTNPTLTTIHQDAEQKGVLATDMILAQLRNQEIPQRSIILPVSLVERGSVRDLNKTER